MSSTPLLSADEWMWRADLAAREAEAAGFAYTAEAFRELSKGSLARWKLGSTQDGVVREPVLESETIAR